MKRFRTENIGKRKDKKRRKIKKREEEEKKTCKLSVHAY